MKNEFATDRKVDRRAERIERNTFFKKLTNASEFFAFRTTVRIADINDFIVNELFKDTTRSNQTSFRKICLSFFAGSEIAASRGLKIPVHHDMKLQAVHAVRGHSFRSPEPTSASSKPRDIDAAN